MRALLGSAIRAAGHELVAAVADCDGAEATLSAIAPDALILDSRFAGTDVARVVVRLRAASPRTAIFVLAALRDRGAARAAVEAGACGAILRPLKPGAVADALRSLADARE